jgi:hypothetical protein
VVAYLLSNLLGWSVLAAAKDFLHDAAESMTSSTKTLLLNGRSSVASAQPSRAEIKCLKRNSPGCSGDLHDNEVTDLLVVETTS